MAKLTPNQLDRSRPSSGLQPRNLLETTPVLFRLPTVEVHPLPAVGDLSTATIQHVKVAAAAPAVAEPETPPASIVSQPAVATEEKQSWWEHWSSGIVLVVLLVALYVTSVAVLKSRSYKPANTLADEKNELTDLTTIDLPQIPTSAMVGSTAESKSPELTLPVLTLENAVDTKVRAEELVGSVSNTLELTNGHANDTTAENASRKAEQSPVGNEPLATAQLLEPTQMPQALPLLPSASASSGSGNVPAQSVSTQVGQSPALYDGATNRADSNSGSGTATGSIPLPTLTSPNTQAPAQSNSETTDAALPAYSQGYSQPTISGAAIPNLVSTASQQTPTASTISSQQSGTPTASGTGATTARLTETPDANGEVEAIIKAYLELMQAGQAAQSTQQQTTTTPTNRYQPTR